MCLQKIYKKFNWFASLFQWGTGYKMMNLMSNGKLKSLISWNDTRFKLGNWYWERMCRPGFKKSHNIDSPDGFYSLGFHIYNTIEDVKLNLFKNNIADDMVLVQVKYWKVKTIGGGYMHELLPKVIVAKFIKIKTIVLGSESLKEHEKLWTHQIQNRVNKCIPESNEINFIGKSIGG